MEGKNQYWENELEMNLPHGMKLEFRADVALMLLTHFGSVAAKIQGEDSAGRSKIELQDPKELVDRCFAIADAFVDKAESRGEMKASEISLEQKAHEAGRLAKVRLDAEFERPKATQTRDS